MSKSRLEAFSDGVLAIIITIMVLELKTPASSDVRALQPLVPLLLSYLLSFVFVGIYWNNHHHLLHACRHVSGRVLWANLHLLFWLSLVPFVTSWLGASHFASWPVAIYGVILLMAGMAYSFLTKALMACQGPNTLLADALGFDLKGKLSLLLYSIAIVVAFIEPWISCALYVAVAVMWFVPDRRIEQKLIPPEDSSSSKI